MIRTQALTVAGGTVAGGIIVGTTGSGDPVSLRLVSQVVGDRRFLLRAYRKALKSRL